MLTTSIFPARYVQGAHALAHLSEETARLGAVALAIVDPAVAGAVTPTLAVAGPVAFTVEAFGGECSGAEIDRLVAVAHARKVPVVIVPTLASTDAPCSALSVIYTPEGAFERYLILPKNPDVVLVDTALIAAAPVRFLVSGMGDALSTFFEAEDCAESGATNMTGRHGSMTALALARLCYDTLLKFGVEARTAAAKGEVTEAVERIVEANTLLSGLGFESGGLSGAHAVHNGLTALAPTHAFWHGEKVAIGTQTLLYLTGRPAHTIAEVYDFCEAVGLPTTLADIGLADPTDADLMKVAELACAPGETIFNAPTDVTPQAVFEALKAADAHGRHLKARHAAKAA